MNPSRLTAETELRHLPATHTHQLVGLLDINDNWKQLASVISNPDRPDELLFKTTDISILEEQRKRPSGSSAHAMLQHWSTYGRRRHTLTDAIGFLERCGLIRAAEIIKNCIKDRNPDVVNDLLQKTHNWNDLPEYTSFAGPVQPSAPNEWMLSFSGTQIHDHSGNEDNSTLIRFNYRNLQLATDNFSPKTIDENGTKLGEGTFGEVFRCATALLNNYDRISLSKFVAVKRFKLVPTDPINREEFLSELNIMRQFQHPNLIKLLGYSDDGPYHCIVTEHLANGSLYHYMFTKRNTLNYRQRYQIILDITDAIAYLHSYTSIDANGNPVNRPFIHRDIKSANILLDDQFRARLSDLGLVRQGSLSNMETTIVTKTIKGTSIYMAPEAFRGDVSVKVDTFSFGVVLLELLTGMAAFDADREESDMISYIDEILGDEFDQLNSRQQNPDNNCNDLITFVREACHSLNKAKLEEILDKKCQDWNSESIWKLIVLAKRCIEQRKKNRPTMIEVQTFLSSFQLQ